MNNPYQFGPPMGAPQWQQPQQPQQPQQQPPWPQQPGQYGPPPGPAGMPSFGGQMPSPPQNANPFFNLNGADPTGGNRYPFLQPGHHLLEIDKISMIESRQKKKLLYIIECTLLATTSRDPSMQVGGKNSAMIDMSNVDTRDKHVKRLICAVLGSDPSLEQHKGTVAPDGQPWDVHAVASIGATQPWRGKRVGCYSHNIETKSGDDFTVNDWLPETMIVPYLQGVGAPGRTQQPHQGGIGASGAPLQQPGAPQGYPANGYGGQSGQPGYVPQQGYAPPQTPPGQPQFTPPQGPPQAAPAPQPGYGGPPQAQPAQGQPQPGYGGPPGWPQWG